MKRALVADFEDVTSITVTDTGSDPDTDGTISAVTMAIGTNFEDFRFPKDTSMFSQDWVGDLVADTHSWSQTIEMGFRRIDLRKRNAIMLLAEGRRDLIAFAQDFNDDWWALGTDQGVRLNANPSTSNNTRAAGQAVPVTLFAENERHQWYKVDSSIIDALLIPAV
jgi:hypothetical protein